MWVFQMTFSKAEQIACGRARQRRCSSSLQIIVE
jgi:hypothetical protein